MPIYGYTHEKIASMEKYISEHDIQSILLEQFGTMHERVCSANEHMQISTGINKGKCKYCLKTIAKPIEEPIGPGP